ncbi:Cytochrome c551 peroxidase precursor [Thalassoglobus neptunius]|uniref:Cytochrome c551 peroxidase n=1 Tax=Thalassoglobus neptunius TaxID=1938619 RepID=A0A5C5X611_9PLAN|nr:cytochrome c peroxidase [Thalassoglobus neptunius]TWT57625.1 Cytochrome c551 peroxidase precursor [Thalassoglobus neptunius]
MKKLLFVVITGACILSIGVPGQAQEERKQNAIAKAKAKAKELGPKTVKLGEGELLHGIPGEGDLKLREIRKWLTEPELHRVIEPVLPLGLAAGASQIKGLDRNPLTQAKIELGRQLYFDPRLSADTTISCATCHHPDEGYGRFTKFGVGIGGQEGNRNSPVSYNRILSDLQFWDGRAASLEEQAVGPIANPIEMGNTHEAAVGSIKNIPGYVLQFRAVFGGKGKNAVNIENVADALASFERTLVTGPAAYDFSEEMKRFAQLDPEDLEDLIDSSEEFAKQYEFAKQGAESNPMSESALRGQELFFSERVNCAACHVGANLADEKYHNLGIGMDAEDPDVGRYAVTKDEKDWGAFKTPTVRNVVHSAPYMHDGSLDTLMDVVEHYNKGGTPNKNLSDKIVKLNLTEQEKLDLVAFMEALTGSFPEVEDERLPADPQE